MKKITVLVIEDNWAVFELIKATLTSYHNKHNGYQYQVIHASDGLEGLEQTWLYTPDIILLDIQLPLLNGYEVLKSLRGRGVTIPVIVMTASTEEREQQKAFAAGCNSYITKPFKPSSLHRYFQELLREERLVPQRSKSSPVRKLEARYVPQYFIGTRQKEEWKY